MTDYMTQYKRNLRAMNKSGRGTPVPGEIWWVSMLDNIKDRPILVLECGGGNVTFRKCTSQASTFRHRDFIEDFYDAGLDKATFVDPELRTIPRTRLVRRMGELSEYDRQKFGL